MKLLGPPLSRTAPGLLAMAGSLVVGAAVGGVHPSAGMALAFLLAAVQGTWALASP